MLLANFPLQKLVLSPEEVLLVRSIFPPFSESKLRPRQTEERRRAPLNLQCKTWNDPRVRRQMSLGGSRPTGLEMPDIFRQ